MVTAHGASHVRQAAVGIGDTAGVDAARDVQIIEKLSQASDHPILLAFPESEYLKGLVCRVF